MISMPAPARAPRQATGDERPRVGIVSGRHRLCAALRRPLHEAPALLAEQVEAAGASGVSEMLTTEFSEMNHVYLKACLLYTSPSPRD